MLKNKTKYGFLLLFLLSFTFQSVYAFGWMGTQTINDHSNDLKRFDYNFYNQFTVDTEKDIYTDLNNMSNGFNKAWYSDQSSEITKNEKEDYGYIDVYTITIEPFEDEFSLSVRLGGSLKDVESWMMFIWSYGEDIDKPMLLALFAFDDEYILIDYENTENYEAEFDEINNEFECTIENKSWNGDNIKFISIGSKDYTDKGDIIIDIYPNPTNFNFLYFYTVLIVILIGLLALMYYLYQKNQ